jgi:hypothetical protein
MTDTDSSKVIEKLTEVLELLKAAKKEPVKEVKEVEVPKKSEEEVKCTEKCPLRKVMSEKEFAEFCKMAEGMKKEDFVKICSKGECGSCPFMKKTVAFDIPEEFEQEQKVYQEQSSRECFQVINTILSLVLLVLFFVFLFRTIKSLYCTV